MAIDRDAVLRIASLSRLTLTAEEVDRYGAQLDAVLAYIDQLRALNIDGIEPFSHAGGLKSVTRGDAPRQSLPADVALANAPDKTGPYFTVPRILEQ
jgi:aspartyl-tRNA(Asn)/glutamyl-tRNA(Gln) amidotransferase subunit C